MREHPAKRIEFEGNAAGGRREVLPCRVNEDRTSAPRNTRTRIVVNLNDEIVEIVLARQAVDVCMRGYFNRPIVVAVRGVFAPAVIPGYPLHRQ